MKTITALRGPLGTFSAHGFPREGEREEEEMRGERQYREETCLAATEARVAKNLN